MRDVDVNVHVHVYSKNEMEMFKTCQRKGSKQCHRKKGSENHNHKVRMYSIDDSWMCDCNFLVRAEGCCH
ncbi:hypothetical protein CY34DRAFT_646810 [Suillus luteus UH-Slu-Lm8-n1]|uniref:Uncharacterized protein n=1 Tax=Suillus luteus UH-Slu-Lm8-n1 TaxID=930992 RepID=A0A0C9ZA29_9AGAM|nr:hypothetical protein CY34DRAFT_646810 [Suillus luteus UH-Slu-Lm8-n1]